MAPPIAEEHEDAVGQLADLRLCHEGSQHHISLLQVVPW